MALELEAHGIRRLHVVDLDGAASHHVVNYRTLEQIAVRTSLIIDFGGGVKSDEDLVIAFEKMCIRDRSYNNENDFIGDERQYIGHKDRM